jgi:copper chaperone
MEDKTELSLNVSGMHCDGCVRRLSATLGKLPGVEVEEVTVGLARLRYEASKITPDQIGKAVERAGFTSQAQ